MLYAKLQDGEKGPPTNKGQRAICPHCEDEVLAKCGQIVRPHWSHKADRECDPWGEPEGEWHRGWKELVLPNQCEVTMKRTEGGLDLHHRADIVGDWGVVIELQHSAISPETIQARESFYGHMVWVFDVGWVFGEGSKIGSTRFVYMGVLDDEPRVLVMKAGQVPMAKGVTHLSEADFDLVAWGSLGLGSNVSPWDSSILVRWFRSQKALETVHKPIYLDFGRPVKESSTYRVTGNPNPDSSRYEAGLLFEEAESGPSMLRVLRLGGGKLEGQLIDRREFLRRHLVGSLRSDGLVSEVREYYESRAQRVSLFRTVRSQARLIERQRVERKRLEEEGRKALIARRQAEVEAEERERVARFEAWLATASLSDLLGDGVQSALFLSRNHVAIEDKLRDLRSSRVTELLQLPPIEWATAWGKMEFTLNCLRGKVKSHRLMKDGDTALIVRGPFDQRLIPRLRVLRFEWDKDQHWWRWDCTVTRERKLLVKTILDDCNNKLVLDELSAADRFEHDCLSKAKFLRQNPDTTLADLEFSEVLRAV